jgi:hypothetical protein
MKQQVKDKALVEDLEQRIDTLQAIPDEAFGAFTRLDWILLVIAAVVLPVIALLAAR